MVSGVPVDINMDQTNILLRNKIYDDEDEEEIARIKRQ